MITIQNYRVDGTLIKDKEGDCYLVRSQDSLLDIERRHIKLRFLARHHIENRYFLRCMLTSAIEMEQKVRVVGEGLKYGDERVPHSINVHSMRITIKEGEEIIIC